MRLKLGAGRIDLSREGLALEKDWEITSGIQFCVQFEVSIKHYSVNLISLFSISLFECYDHQRRKLLIGLFAFDVIDLMAAMPTIH
jgi:hypothetical protein